jgi:serine/threonine-protein kinase
MQATLSHYRILEEIGAGGMGVVYRAHDDHLDRDVALKVLPHPGTPVQASTRKRFHQEALMLSRLNHPNIATVHDFDTQDGIDFLVEEFIEGLSLDTMLASGPLSENEIIHLGSQLADGLAAAHEHGILHRDLKPANLRITPDARLKILDFGLAVIVRGEASPSAITASLNETTGFVGTLPYMAPEQLLGAKLDVRTDLWAAGCVLYEMATGLRPFLGSGPALTDAILHQPPPTLSKINPRISAALDGVIQKCLEKNPQKRYSSAREISIDLQRTPSIPVSPKRISRQHWLAAIVLTVLMAFAVGGGVRLRSRSQVHSVTQQTTAATNPTAPHESYLAGLKYLERWDKPANLDAATALFTQAVKADPSFALGFSALAEVAWARYRLDHDSRWIDEAEINCRRAAELNQRLPAVYVTLARIHNGRGQYNLALQEIQQALQLEPLNTDALLSQAAVFASMGQEEKAETTYRKAAGLRPQEWSGHYELGVFYFRHRRYADASAAFERVLEITPDNAMALATLGGMLQLVHRDVEAEQHLKRSLTLQPSYAAYTNLGALYIREGRWSEAAEITRKALEINANDWAAWSNLGHAYEWLNLNTKADEAYRHELARLKELAKVGGDDAEVQAELGLVYSRWRLRDKAVPLIEAALMRAPEDPTILATAGQAYENLGDRTIALGFLKKALAQGGTLKQLEVDPGLRKLLQDPRFREMAQQLNQISNSAQQHP